MGRARRIAADRHRVHRFPAGRELTFAPGTDTGDHVKIAILAGSLLAASLATIVLRIRSAQHRRICAAEELDSDADGVPDVYDEATARPS